MSVNILDHEFVPKHEILSKKETKEVLEEFNTEKHKLPNILLTDPVVKLIEAKVGDVIRITRKSPTAGQVLYYRIVV